MQNLRLLTASQYCPSYRPETILEIVENYPTDPTQREKIHNYHWNWIGNDKVSAPDIQYRWITKDFEWLKLFLRNLVVVVDTTENEPMGMLLFCRKFPEDACIRCAGPPPLLIVRH